MNRLAAWLLVPVAFVALALPAPAAQLVIPPPQGYVTDTANVLRPDARAWLNANCQALEQQKKVQLAVLLVPDLQNTTVEDFAQKAFDSWKIGDKETRKGLLFLVSMGDRKVRIHVGYGLEGDLPDGKIGAILDQWVLPSLKASDLSGGVMAGVAAVMQSLGASTINTGGVVPGARRHRHDDEGAPPWVILLILAFVVGLCYVSPFWRYMILDMLFRGGGGGGSGGFSGGSGFGGFGGGSSGGGGASRSW